MKGLLSRTRNSPFLLKNAKFFWKNGKNGPGVFCRPSFFYLLRREFCKDHYTLSEFLTVRDPPRAVVGVPRASVLEVPAGGGLFAFLGPVCGLAGGACGVGSAGQRGDERANEDGKYEIVFHYDKGSLAKIDLSQAYVAYYAMTVQDQIDTIVGEDLEDFPPLPEDAQIAFDESIGTMELRKIARIKIQTLNDNTVSVSFTDTDDPLPGREYFFVIPNAGLGGSVIPY